MATEAPACPKCKSPCGTPVNSECGVEIGRFHGPEHSNLKCPACGIGWRGTDLEVADAWRSFVEWEQKETREELTIGVSLDLNGPQTSPCRCGHSMAAHEQSMAAPGKCHADGCACARFNRPDEPETEARP